MFTTSSKTNADYISCHNGTLSASAQLAVSRNVCTKLLKLLDITDRCNLRLHSYISVQSIYLKISSPPFVFPCKEINTLFKLLGVMTLFSLENINSLHIT